MTTLSINRPRPYELGMRNELPVVAADIVYEGAAVGDDGSGYGRPLVAGDLFCGFAEARADNSSGAAGAVAVRMRIEGAAQLYVTGLAATDIGAAVYASDDDTFTLSSTGNSLIGRVRRFISSGLGVVQFAPGGVLEQPGYMKFTEDGGFAVKLTNRSGGVTVKGEVVTSSSLANNAVQKIVKDVPDPIGVFLESGVADGEEAWVVVGGVAYVYFTGNTTAGQFARGYLTADGAGYVAGQALCEAFPVSPFSSDKHFYEIGHVLETRVGAGLAKVNMHFN